MIIRLATMYGSEGWVVKKQNTQQMSKAKMRMLRWILEITRKDQLRNEFILNRLRLTPIINNLRKNQLRWYGHVPR